MDDKIEQIKNNIDVLIDSYISKHINIYDIIAYIEQDIYDSYMEQLYDSKTEFNDISFTNVEL